MTRFIMIGGFLGAGKTTTILRLAEFYSAQGRRVGLVTNDQANELVDTNRLRAAGFHVGEVPGACFCCKFDDLVATMGELEAEQTPEIIIAEPVGSCTDLMATVVEPLRQLHGDRFQVGPLAVLLKPEHGQRVLLTDKPQGVSPGAAYIFNKQLEEADVIAINKVDKLSQAQQTRLHDEACRRFPDRPILLLSAREGAGMEGLRAALEESPRGTRRFMDMDYDLYAEGEAELGWLNATYTLSRADGTISLDQAAGDFLRALAQCYATVGADSAHTKVLATDGSGNQSLANLVGADAEVELSASNDASASTVHLTVNARVTVGADQLTEWVTSSLNELCQQRCWQCQCHDLQSLQPGRPRPTHRWQNSS